MWTFRVYVILNLTHTNKSLFPGNFIFNTSKVVEKLPSLRGSPERTSQIVHIQWIVHRFPVPRPFLQHEGDFFPHPSLSCSILCFALPLSLRPPNPLTHHFSGLALGLAALQCFHSKIAGCLYRKARRTGIWWSNTAELLAAIICALLS